VEGAVGADDAADAQAEARADEALERFLPTAEEAVARNHRVTALVVSREGATWLPRTLAAIKAQVRIPDLLIGIDAGSADGSGALLRGAIGTVIEVGAEEGLAGALRAGAIADALLGEAPPGRVLRGGSLAGAEPAGEELAGEELAGEAPLSERMPGSQEGAEPEVVHWYWILHDDSAPQPDCLEQLLAGADRAPGAHVLVTKSVAWSDSGRLVGIGARWAPGVPVVERLEPRERDQGQYDVDRPVYAGNSAGMLVRVDTWHELAGMDSLMGGWAGPPDLCRRTWAMGAQVMFIPAAVVAHRQAGQRGVRPSDPPALPPRRVARHGQLLLELTQGPAHSLPWRWLRGWLSTLVRSLALLLTREPEEASAELAGAWDVLVHPRRLHRARATVRRPPVHDLTRPAQVRAPRGAVLGHALDAWAAAAPRRARTRQLHIPRRVWVPLALAAGLAVLSLARDAGIVIGSGTVRGGGLLPAPSATGVIGSYLDSWQEARFGVPSGQPAYLPLLALASLPLLGSVDLLLRLVLGLAVPLAFLSAYVSIGPRFVGRNRISLALAWALLPAGVAAAGAGRISTVGLLLLAPPTARLLADALLRARDGDRALRPAIAAGTLLGATSAFAPYAGLLVLVIGLLAWAVARFPRWPVRTGVVVIACTAVFVGLWGVRVLRAPWLLLSDLGRNDPSLATPGPWLAGLSPGGPTAPGWVGVALVVLVVALVVALAPRGGHLAGLMIALALAALVAWTPAVTSVLWPDAPQGSVWPGQPLLLAGGVLAVVAAHLAAGRDEPGRAGPLGSVADRIGGSVAGLAWLAVVAVLAVGWWMAPSLVAVGTGTGLPPVVGLAEETVERPRAVVLARDGREVRYGVSSAPQAWLGMADALAAPESDPDFTEVVAALVSGAGGDVERELGGRGIRYVVFDGAQGDPLVGELDAVIGLRRLASAAEQSLWQVTGQPVRAALVGGPDDPEVVVPISTTPTSIDVVLHPLALLPRALELAESADPGWQARSAGADLALSEDAHGMLTTTVTAAGPLQVEHGSSWTSLAGGQLVLMVVLAVLALPKRRTLDLDGEHEPDREPDRGTDPERESAPDREPKA
jgi:GT2 family glycosyltransferase